MVTNYKRLAKNTLLLYMRSIISMVISLYSVRVLLSALGVEDYGIQNVVSGIVLMFSFVTGSLSAAVSRFMAIEIEKKNIAELNKVYSSSLHIMLLVSLLVIILIETIAVWFLNTEMNISAERIYAANWVLQFSGLTLIISLLSVPFDALIISYERMGAFAYISILSNFLKLLIAFLVLWSPIDKLVYYGFLLFVQALIVRICYGVYCSMHFKEICFNWTFDKKQIRTILNLSVWDLWGSSSYILKNYGSNIILNIFLGAAINAARGIAMQVNMAITQFSSGFLTALRPQLIKEYASGRRDSLWKMVNLGTKFSTFLLMLIALPIVVECEFILKIWLGEVPDHTVNFVVLIILLSISEGTLIYAHNTVLIADGRIKKCQLITGTIQLLNIPFAYLLLKSGFSAESTILISILIAHICCFIRCKILSDLTGYSVRLFVQTVYIRLIGSSLLMFIPMIFLRDTIEQSWCRAISMTIICLLWGAIIILYLGCTKNERNIIFGNIRNFIGSKRL